MIIAVASQKGGVGKTSTAISLAAGLARKGKKTLLIDIDSQANSSKVLLPKYSELPSEKTIFATILERKPLTVHKTDVPNLSLVPSHILLSNTDIELTTALDHREARLKNELEPVAKDYDHIFIDCPPTLSWLTINALTASDRVIVVVSPGYFELDSIIQISKTVKEVRDIFNPSLELMGFLFTMLDPTINTATSLQILRQTYTDKILKTVIPRNTVETLKAGVEKLQAKRTRLQHVYLDPDIGLTKEEYLAEKKILDDELSEALEDIERIEKELQKVPTKADLVTLEEMAVKIVDTLGEDLDIPDLDKRKILEMLNVKVLLSPDGKIAIEGWFTPEDSGLLSTSSPLHSHQCDCARRS